MSERCPWTETLGAYLLGGLDERERLGMRAHLDGCVICAAELDELEPVARLLQTVDVDRVRDGLEPSPALGVAVLASARRVERRQRWVKAGAFLAAAAVLLVALGFVRTDQEKAKVVGQRIELIAAEQAPGVQAWVDVQSVRAGTYAVFHMKGLPADQVYRMWFEDLQGGRVPLGTFKGVDGVWLVCPTTTSFTVQELSAVGASDANGVTLLRAALPRTTGAGASGSGPSTTMADVTSMVYTP